MAELKDRETLINLLLESNKRANEVLDSAQSLGAKLFGPMPEGTTAASPEVSVIALAQRLSSLINEIGNELNRQHNSVGQMNVPAQQARASGY